MLGQKRPTKREILRTAMSVFDPLDLAAPLTIAAKRILQATWKLGTDWDEEVPDDVYKDWNTWLEHLQALKKLDIPRCYPGCTHAVKRELHTFVDASEHTYAASTYWRTTAADGSINVSLVMAKARVAPLKITSVPRLELQAAVMGVRLARCTEEDHDVKPDQRVFWTDSRTVLTWIKTGARAYKPFVAHRLAEIEEETKTTEWRWVPTAHNVADDATREPPAYFDQAHRWFRGPEFLRHPKEEWPSETRAIARSPPTGEERTRTDIIQALPDITRFSSWQRLRRATARALQFIDRCKAGRGLREGTHAISHRRTQKTEQNDPNWRQTLKKVKKIDKTIHTSANKRKFVLLEASSRIGCNHRNKGPPVVDGHHPYVRLYVQAVHEQLHHAGVEATTNEVRQRLWVLRMRPTIRTVIKNCLRCRIRRATPGEPPTGNLPAARLAHHQRPFSYVGLDYYGPYNVAIGRQHQKRYVALFTCLTTRAVHLEVAGGLSADSAILAIRRMMARSAPVEIWSDNGTNFHGADAELQKTAREAAAQEASARAIDWRYIPPAPLSWVELGRLVQSIKRALAVTLREMPEGRVFTTLLLEAEYTVNSRPLTHVSVSADDPEALTPNHFYWGSGCLPVVQQLRHLRPPAVAPRPETRRHVLDSLDTSTYPRCNTGGSRNAWMRGRDSHIPRQRRRSSSSGHHNEYWYPTMSDEEVGRAPEIKDCENRNGGRMCTTE
ncbi:hypothetical protein EVAR_95905_1 [Eumeta japonica]|uniref:Integrase catalytic domain-containing protein n=1 Tax=Eumeta variegata TaxID=151549 RepID=A0A4C1XIM1_EUMVA|nr:hypothetical protein EVAR_95905_1 [Eumeta japonica]